MSEMHVQAPLWAAVLTTARYSGHNLKHVQAPFSYILTKISDYHLSTQAPLLLVFTHVFTHIFTHSITHLQSPMLLKIQKYVPGLPHFAPPVIAAADRSDIPGYPRPDLATRALRVSWVIVRVRVSWVFVRVHVLWVIVHACNESLCVCMKKQHVWVIVCVHEKAAFMSLCDYMYYVLEAILVCMCMCVCVVCVCVCVCVCVQCILVTASH